MNIKKITSFLSIFAFLFMQYYFFTLPVKAEPTGVNTSLMQSYGLNADSYFWKKGIWNRTTSSYARDVVTRPYPRLIGNQWNVYADGREDNGDTNKYQEYAAKYFDFIYLNRVRGSYSDKFVDVYESTKDPNRGLLTYRNKVYEKAQKHNRRCYVLIYHAQEGIENYSPPTSGHTYWFSNHPDNPWRTSSNKGTWDLVSAHNAWYKYSNGGYVAYTHYDVNKRRVFDHRNSTMRNYWVNHAYHSAAGDGTTQFDGIFADNWMRSIGSDSSGWMKGVNLAGQALKSKWNGDKILIGNGYYTSYYNNSRDFGMVEDWSGNWRWDFSQTDAFANKGQLTMDTSAKSSYGSLWNRLARNLMTDDVFGIHDDENGGVVYFVDNYISKLGKIGYPLEDRVNLGENCYKRSFTHGIAYWNNSGKSYTVNIPSGKYKDIYGNNIEGNKTLSNRTGLILKTRDGYTPPSTPIDPVEPEEPTNPTPEEPTNPVEPTNPPLSGEMQTPSNLVVTSMSKGSTSGDVYVHLTWRDNSSNESGFELYQSFSDSNNYKLIKTVQSNNAQYNVNLGNSPQNGYYYYKVRAINTTDKTEFSNEVNTKYGTLPTPNAPTEFKVNNIAKGATTGDYFVNVSWKDNSSDEEFFKVYQSIGDENNYRVIKTPPANSTKYGINIGKNIQQGNYYYKATAINVEGESSASNTATKFIGVKAPSDVNVSSVKISSTSGRYFVNLNWKDNSDNESGFEILESIGNQDNFKVIKTPDANSQNYGIDIGSTPTMGARYYKVRAKNSAFVSTDSNIATADIKVNIPSAPTNVAVKNVTKGATSGNIYVNLTWQDTSNNEDGFKIYQAINSNTDFKEIKTPAKDAQSYGISIGSNPTPGTYYYKVAAVNSSGNSADSNIANTNIAGISINAPSNLRIESAFKGSSSGHYFINLRWNDNANNEDGYEILHSFNNTNDFKIVKTPKPNTTSYGVDIGSNPGRGTHYFVVRAKKDNSYSGYSNTVSKSLSY